MITINKKWVIILSMYLINDILAPPVPPMESPYDDNGCCSSCGYTWCPEIKECVRVWETYCKSLDTGH